jgi:hypothetical protein
MRVLAALYLVISLACAGPAFAQNVDSARLSGAVAGQAIGRVIFDAQGDAQLVAYFTVFAGLQNLFTGPRSEATARITARSTKFRVETTLNGTAVHFRTVPAEGSAILVKLYYDISPDQDFNDPDRFSDGEMFAVWRWHSSLGTLSPTGITPSIGAVDLVSSDVIVHDGLPFNVKTRGDRATAHFNILMPQVLGPNMSVPFSAAFIVSR